MGFSGASKVTLMDREPVALACSMLSAVASGIPISEDLPSLPSADSVSAASGNAAGVSGASGSAAGDHHSFKSSVGDSDQNSGSRSPEDSCSTSTDSRSRGTSGTNGGGGQREGPTSDPSLLHGLSSQRAGELRGSDRLDGDTWPLGGSGADALLRELVAELQSLGITVPFRWATPRSRLSCVPYRPQLSVSIHA